MTIKIGSVVVYLDTLVRLIYKKIKKFSFMNLYLGYKCDLLIQNCIPNPCENGATCTQAGVNQFSCTCPTGLTGLT